MILRTYTNRIIIFHGRRISTLYTVYTLYIPILKYIYIYIREKYSDLKISTTLLFSYYPFNIIISRNSYVSPIDSRMYSRTFLSLLLIALPYLVSGTSDCVLEAKAAAYLKTVTSEAVRMGKSKEDISCITELSETIFNAPHTIASGGTCYKMDIIRNRLLKRIGNCVSSAMTVRSRYLRLKKGKSISNRQGVCSCSSGCHKCCIFLSDPTLFSTCFQVYCPLSEINCA